DALHAERDVSILPLPTQFTDATTFLVWPGEHRSAALDALRRELAQENVGQTLRGGSSAQSKDFSPALNWARRGSIKGGSESRVPRRSRASSVANPGPSVASSNLAPYRP